MTGKDGQNYWPASIGGLRAEARLKVELPAGDPEFPDAAMHAGPKRRLRARGTVVAQDRSSEWTSTKGRPMYAPAKSLAVTLALLGAITVAAAQTQAPVKQDTVPPMTGTNKSDQGGKQEPSAKVQGTSPPMSTAVLLNGVLAVPGAPAESQTVPAKFSDSTAAADELPVSGHTFIHLTDAQRAAIHRSVMTGSPAAASVPVPADLSVQVPPEVELRPLPGDAAAQIPWAREHRYTTVGDTVLLVAPSNRIVVGLIKK
jgi:hypothetical protein